MAGRGKKNRTAADETRNRQRLGRKPRLTDEERKEKKIQKDREDRAKKTFQLKECMAFCEMPGIKFMFDAFSKEYRKREENSSSKAMAEEEQELKNKLMMIDESMMMKGTAEEEQELKKKLKMIDERMMREFISRWQERFQKFFEEEGITEKFKAVCLKVSEEEERNYREAYEDLREVMEEHEANRFSNEDLSVTLQNLEMIPTGGQEGGTAGNSSSLRNLQMIQTRRLDGVEDSSSFGAMETPFKRAKELIKRKREEEPDEDRMGTPIGGIMAEARQNSHQPAPARATQGPLCTTILCSHYKEASTSSWAPPQEVSVYDLVKELYHKIEDAESREQKAVFASIDANRKFREKEKEAVNLNKQVKGLKEKISKLKAELAEKGKISKDALELQIIYAVTLGWNLMKELLKSMPAGSEFLKLPLLDTIQLYPSLQNQFNEGLTLIAQGQPINDNAPVQSVDPLVVDPLVVGPCSCFLDFDWLGAQFSSPGGADNMAANSLQFHSANARANNVEQEDDANDQEDG